MSAAATFSVDSQSLTRPFSNCTKWSWPLARAAAITDVCIPSRALAVVPRWIIRTICLARAVVYDVAIVVSTAVVGVVGGPVVVTGITRFCVLHSCPASAAMLLVVSSSASADVLCMVYTIAIGVGACILDSASLSVVSPAGSDPHDVAALWLLWFAVAIVVTGWACSVSTVFAVVVVA